MSLLQMRLTMHAIPAIRETQPRSRLSKCSACSWLNACVDELPCSYRQMNDIIIYVRQGEAWASPSFVMGIFGVFKKAFCAGLCYNLSRSNYQFLEIFMRTVVL